MWLSPLHFPPSLMTSPNNPFRQHLFNQTPFLHSFQRINLANAVGLAISIRTKSHYHLDLIGTGAFAFASLPDANLTLRSKVSAIAVCAWSVKLAFFLFYRALRMHHDGRLTDTLSTWSGTWSFWVVSYAWNVITLLPHSLGTTSSLEGNPLMLRLGSCLFGIGWLIETIADLQKWNFKRSNPGQFCNVGLFRFSQHPNYFGNLLIWIGIFVMNAPALVEPVTSNESSKTTLKMLWRSRRLFVALLSPMFLWMLFSGQANGTLTNALETTRKKYGDNESYQEYIKNVPVIIPRFKLW